MKHLSLTAALILMITAGFSQSFYINTAKKSGNWSDNSTWNKTLRADGKQMTTIVIPKNLTVKLDDNYNLTSLGEVAMEIEGKLEMKANKSLVLGAGSSITVNTGGLIETGAAANNKNWNEQITIGNVVKFDAHIDGQIRGNAFANQLTGASPAGFSLNAMLPVTFVSFTIEKLNEKSIGVNWVTTDEMNNSHFEIQRSENGTNFKSVAFVLPESGNSNMHTYKYTDKYTATGVVYYRIRQVDIDGKEMFSAVRMIGGAKAGSEAQVYVSAKNTVTVNIDRAHSNVLVRLITMNGVVVAQKNNVTEERISLTAYNAAPGTYVVQVSDMKGMMTVKKVLL